METLNPDIVVLEIAVARETAAELKALVDEHLWQPNEGLRMILAAGLGAMRSQRIGEDGSPQKRLVRLAQQLVRSEGRLAALRFDLSEAHRAIKNWELSSGAIREMCVSIEQVIRRQNEEIDGLRTQLNECRLEIERLRTQLALGDPTLERSVG